MAVEISAARAGWRLLAHLGRNLHSAMERALQSAAQISVADFEILQALAEAAGKPLRAGQLADMLTWDRSRLSHQIRRMERRNLVVRNSNDADQRVTEVRLTPLGQETFQQARGAYDDVVYTHLGKVLDARELASLSRIVGALTHQVSPDSCHREVDGWIAEITENQS